jgi:putative acetyltransferase
VTYICSIQSETPLQDEIRVIINELNALLSSLTPPEHCHHMTVEQMARDDTTLFVARLSDTSLSDPNHGDVPPNQVQTINKGKVVGIGALRRHPGKIGEVKRMYTLPSHQNMKIGSNILSLIEVLARQEGCGRLLLETGSNFDAAKYLYAKAEFKEIEGPVLDYPMSPWTAFFEKVL